MTIESGNFDSSGFDLEPPNDGDEEGGSRLFIILAVGLAGLIVLGLVAIGGVLMLRNIRSEQTLAQVTPMATPTLALAAQQPTATSTPPPPTPTKASEEPLVPTATSTPVVAAGSGDNSQGGSQGGGDGVAAGTPVAAESASTSTATAVVPVGTPVGSAEVPDTGFGGLELALIAIGLVAVLFVARRLRRQSI
ncbi:MAG TPA: hypothetical protein G4N96_06815 [Chloroflexi bacterium]|nr:hypothetical protein [Chloroflexota bacterium]